MLPQNELSVERLAGEISALLGNRRQLAQMSAAARGFAHPNAAREIAALVARAAGVPPREAGL